MGSEWPELPAKNAQESLVRSSEIAKLSFRSVTVALLKEFSDVAVG